MNNYRKRERKAALISLLVILVGTFVLVRQVLSPVETAPVGPRGAAGQLATDTLIAAGRGSPVTLSPIDIGGPLVAPPDWFAYNGGAGEAPPPTPDAGATGSAPFYPVPWQLRPEDHFWLSRPVWPGEGKELTGKPNWTYLFATDGDGDISWHRGLDLVANTGTPIAAVADGEVLWAGYGLEVGWEWKNDPYGQAVLIRHFCGYKGQYLYTVYGHLNKLFVSQGVKVKMHQIIGESGRTGNATGPHLHFEVRLGGPGAENIVNPSLWMVPLRGTGVLAGLIDSEYNGGEPLMNIAILVVNRKTGLTVPLNTYPSTYWDRDPSYGENFAIPDLPAGEYRFVTQTWWKVYDFNVTVEAGKTTFIWIRHWADPVINPPLPVPVPTSAT